MATATAIPDKPTARFHGSSAKRCPNPENNASGSSQSRIGLPNSAPPRARKTRSRPSRGNAGVRNRKRLPTWDDSSLHVPRGQTQRQNQRSRKAATAATKSAAAPNSASVPTETRPRIAAYGLIPAGIAASGESRTTSLTKRKTVPASNVSRTVQRKTPLARPGGDGAPRETSSFSPPKPHRGGHVRGG